MQAVQDSRVTIDLNGERGPFFLSLGLRQGDPLSPVLFYLVVDVLFALLCRASREGLLTGLVPYIVEGGLTHLQYADDPVILLENSDTNITNIKFILACYEAMSRMTINYERSEVFMIGGGGARGWRLRRRWRWQSCLDVECENFLYVFRPAYQ